MNSSFKQLASVFAITLFFLTGQQAFAQAPTTPATGIAFSTVTTSSITVTVTPGNGEQRLILMSDSPIGDQPEDDFAYSLNDNIGTSTVVYTGTGNSVTVNNLDSDRTYYFTVFEFNGGPGSEMYLTIGQPSAQQDTRYYPSGGASFYDFEDLNDTSMRVTFSQGSSDGMLIVVKSGSAVDVDPADLTTYTVNPVFGTEAAHMGNGNYAVYSGTGSDVTITGLQPNTTYHFEIFEYNDFGGDKFYLTNYPTMASQKTLYPPTIQATGIVFNSTTTNSISLSVTKGNGQKRMIVAGTSSISGIPEYKSTYSASTTYGNGDYINDSSSYVVYSGTDSTVVVTNLDQNTTYHFTVFEFNDDGEYPVYLTDSAPTALQTTRYAPNSQAGFDLIDQITTTSLRLNFYRGNGDSLIVFARSGSGVNIEPQDEVVYSVNSAFGTSDAIGDGNYAVYSGNDNSAIVTGLQANTTYHFSVYEFNDFTGEKYYLTEYTNTTSQSTRYYPTTQSTITSFSNITNESIQVNLGVGNGGKRIIVVKSGSAVNAVPVDGTSYYTGSGDFTSGASLSDGNIVVYSGNVDNVNISNLNAGTTYHFAVFEFNDFGNDDGQEFYLTSNPPTGSQSTTNVPTSEVYINSVDNITTSSMSLNIDKGDADNILVIARNGAAVNVSPVDFTTYALNDDLGDGNIVAYVGSSNTANITGLDEGSTYHFAAFAFNGGSGQEYYLTNNAPTTSATTYSYPTVQGSNITFSEITNTSMRLTLTKGDGTNRLIVARSEFAVNSVPMDGRDYGTNTWFSNGDSLGTDDNYAIYAGIDSTVVIEGLQQNTTYHFAVFEFNDFGEVSIEPYYLTANPPTTSQITANVPVNHAFFSGFQAITTTSMRLMLSETTDDGENRIVVIRNGAAVTFTPQDSTTYNLNQDLGDGQSVAYAGNQYEVDLTGLTDSTTYYIAVFEYNGGAGQEQYLIADPTTASQLTRYAPYGHSTITAINDIGNKSIEMSLSPLVGDGRIVIARKGAPVNVVPVDGTAYDVENEGSFSSGVLVGDELDDNRVVSVSSPSNSLEVYFLEPGNTYHFAVFEFNSFGDADVDPFYLTANPTTTTQTTTNVPVVPASISGFTNITTSSLQILLDTMGTDADHRLVIARSGAAVNFTPQNGVTYSANSDFGTSTDLGDGNKAVYIGDGPEVDITGLADSTTYYVTVFEFNGEAGQEEYRTSDLRTGSQMTWYYPDSQSSDLVFSEITKSSMRLSLTPGTGEKRIILAKNGSAVDSEPVDKTTYYETQDIGDGNVVVYSGTDTTVVLSGLTSNSTYHFAVFEFNEFTHNDTTSAFYQSVAPLTDSQSTAISATIAASNIEFTNMGSSSVTLSFDEGDGEQRLILAKSGSPVDVDPVDGVAYSANADLGDGNFAVYSGNGNSVNITGLDALAEYHFAIFEFDTVEEVETYLLSTPARDSVSTFAPIPYANLRLLLSAGLGTSLSADTLTAWSDLSGNTLSDTEATTNGTRPRLVQDVMNGKPVIRFTGGQFLNLPTASSLDITDKNSDIFIVYRSTAVYDDVNDIQFLIAGDLGRNELHTNGSDGGGLRFIPNNVGASNNNTTNGQYLDASTTGAFTNTESQIIRLQATDTFGEISVNGKHTVNHPKNSRSSFTGNLRMGLRADASYPLYGDIAEILIYNEILSATARDSVDAYLSAKYGIVTSPSIAASDIQFSELTTTSVRVNLTPGNGERRIIVAKSGSAVDFEPVDGTTYAGNATMGAGNHVVYAGTGSDVTITGLDERTTYHVAVFEYNGDAGEEVYQVTNSASDSVLTRTPIPYADLQLLLSADYGTVIESGGLSSWADQSGNNHNATQDASGFRPTVVDDVINGEPVVRFNGSNNYLILPNTTDLGIVTNDYQVFIVAKSATSTTDKYYLMATSNNNGHYEIRLNDNVSSGASFLPNTAVTIEGGSTGQYTDGEPQLVSVEATSTYGRLRMNGSDLTQLNETSHSGLSTNLVLGVQTGGYFWFAGDIAEVILYNAALSPEARDSVETYLIDKYLRVSPPTDPGVLASSAIGNTSMTLTADPAGDGERRVIVVRAGSAVNATPVDWTTYTGDSNFSTATDLGDGNKVVYVGTGTSVEVTNLAEGTIYHAAVFEYNGTPGREAYLTANPARNSTSTTTTSFAGGAGVEGNPYQITTAAQLDNMRNNLSAHYILNNDIDLDVAPYNTGGGWVPIGTEANPFIGNLNGNHFAIRNLFISRGENNQGLFGRLSGTVSDLELSDVNFAFGDEAISEVGSVAGKLQNGTISGVLADGIITAGNGQVNSFGGLVGYASNSTLENSTTHVSISVGSGGPYYLGGAVGKVDNNVMIHHVTATGNVGGTSGTTMYVNGGFIGQVSQTGVVITHSSASGNVIGDSYTGGFIGEISSAVSISNSSATGTVTSLTEGEAVGGFIGYAGSGTHISNSFASGHVVVETDAIRVGGFIGETGSITIENSYAVGSVTVPSSGSENVGGFVGETYGTTITHSYSIGAVTGDGTAIGGLIGANDGTVTNSYWNTETSGQATSGAGTGLTTSQMNTSTNYTGWDFATVWQITSGASFPWLRDAPGTHRIGAPTITGTQGWRLLSTTVNDSTYASFFNGLWTQGFTGASVEHGAPNVYTWPIDGSSRDSTQWTPLSNASATFQPGTAVLAYIFSDDDGPGVGGNAGFPKTLLREGTTWNSDADLSAQLNPNVGGWSLIGNPYITNVDWDGLTKGNLSNSVYVWDSSTPAQWRSWNGSTGGLDDGLIGPFNGFFVETLDADPTLTVPTSARVDGTSVFLGKEEANPIATIELTIHSKGGLTNSSWIQFTATGLDGKDRMDAIKLVPLSPDYLQVASFSSEYGKLLDINHLPLDFDLIEIPVDVISTYSEEHQLMINTDLLPLGWKATLRDNETGKTYESGDLVAFTPERRAKKAANGAATTPVIEAQSTEGPRFLLIVERGESDNTDPQIPDEFSLSQNFPNPFNPTTVFSFQLSVDGRTSLKVYDVVGREVAVVIEDMMSAGTHSITFDASKLSSGVYIYRLQTAQGVLMRKMVLLK